jgi:sucrose-6-phosphate hydrolase SacC (GH32 family)
MSNWEYANDDPTSPWRGMFTIPRALRLVATRDGLRLAQEPVAEMRSLRGDHASVPAREIAGPTPLEGVAGDALEIAADFAPGTASSFGIAVRKGPSEETVVGYDVRAGELFVDRRRSGNVSVHSGFAGRHSAPLVLERGEPLRLRVFVDRSSVETFAADGRVVITDRIFPDPASQAVGAWAEGGKVRLTSLDAWRLDAETR